MWKLPNGRIIRHPSSKMIEIDGVNHPERNLLYWKDDDLAKYGIYRYVEKGYDQKHFNSTGKTETISGQTITVEHTVERKYTIRKMKRMKIREARQTASTLIRPYEWHITRSIQDPSFPIRADIGAYITAVRASVTIVETEVKALSTARQIINYNYNDKWPAAPDTDDPLNGDLQE